MDTETIREALRADFNATLRALADHIAQTYTGPEDARIEIAHAIARHLGTEGWPSASPWRAIEGAPEEGEFLVYMPGERMKIQVAKWHPNVKVIGSVFAFDLTKPTHWMPLPEPPKGGEDGRG